VGPFPDAASLMLFETPLINLFSNPPGLSAPFYFIDRAVPPVLPEDSGGVQSYFFPPIPLFCLVEYSHALPLRAPGPPQVGPALYYKFFIHPSVKLVQPSVCPLFRILFAIFAFRLSIAPPFPPWPTSRLALVFHPSNPPLL